MGVAIRKPGEGDNGSAAGTIPAAYTHTHTHAETCADAFVSAQPVPTTGGPNNTLIFHHSHHPAKLQGERGGDGRRRSTAACLQAPKVIGKIFWEEERAAERGGGREGCDRMRGRVKGEKIRDCEIAFLGK